MPTRAADIDPFEHARQLVAELRGWTERELKDLRVYIDARNKHRQGDIDTIGKTAHQQESDLMRGERPGWVALEFRGVHEDLDDLATAAKVQAATSRRQNQLLIATLVALSANLIVLLFTLHGGKPL